MDDDPVAATGAGNADASMAAVSPENNEAAPTSTTESLDPAATPQEMPFLVTHWLENYDRSSSASSNCPNDKQQEAMARIRRATSEIASAFATLGAYGTTFRVSFFFVVAAFTPLF